MQENSCHLFSLGRHALWHGIRALALHPGDEVLVPALNHGSEVEVFTRAGLRCRFYEATSSLEPDPAELERALAPNVKALHLIHYLGFPQDAGSWRTWCDERGLALIEDAAQAWLTQRDGQPVGSFGHVAIFCAYKTYGLPDGAFLVCDGTVLTSGYRRPPLGAKALLKREVSLRKKMHRRVRETHTLRPFELGDPDTGATTFTRYMLVRLADQKAAYERRRNYAYLLERFGEYVPTPFDQLSPQASPFALPVESAGKQVLIDALRHERVRAESFWSQPHPAIPLDRFPRAAGRRARTVALPMHQELSQRSLEKIATVVTHFFR